MPGYCESYSTLLSAIQWIRRPRLSLSDLTFWSILPKCDFAFLTRQSAKQPLGRAGLLDPRAKPGATAVEYSARARCRKSRHFSEPSCDRGALAVFGSGKALAVLKSCRWMESAQVIYWGDCDEAGYGILSGLRSAFPHVRRVLMDEWSWHKWKHLATPGRRDPSVRHDHLTDTKRAALKLSPHFSVRLKGADCQWGKDPLK